MKNEYARQRAFEKSSKVRWRGQLWYQLLVFLIWNAVGFIFAMFVGMVAKVVWFCLSSGFGNFAFAGWGYHVEPPFTLDNLQYLAAQSMTLQDVLSNRSWIIYVLMFFAWAVFFRLSVKQWWDWSQLYANRVRNLNRFATIREINRTYKLVPDRNRFYKGQFGEPMAHIKGYGLTFASLHPILWLWQLIKAPLGLNKEVFPQWYAHVRPKLMRRLPWLYVNQETVEGGYEGFYFIDDKPTHKSVLGATRVGKDQQYGYISIDLMRRAEIQPNIVDTDAKNEDAKMSYIPLRKAGYEVQLVNIQDVDWSESWNPLQTALTYAQDGEWDKARDEASVVVQIMGSDMRQTAGTDPTWDNAAEDTQLAIVLVLLWLAIETDDASIVTPASIIQFANSMATYTDPEKANGDGLTQFFEMVRQIDPRPPILNEALLRAAQFLSATGDTKTSIMFSFQARSRLFASETVARITSQSTIQVSDYGFPRLFKAYFDTLFAGATATIELIDLDKPKARQLVEQDKIKVSRSGIVEYPFHNNFPKSWQIVLDFSDAGNDKHLQTSKVSLTGTMRQKRKLNGKWAVDQYSKQPIMLVNVEKKENHLFQRTSWRYDLRYSEKPAAVFLITPQNNDNYASIASLFLGQTFSINTAIASNITRKKMDRAIIYKLNEFSMFPRIPGFDSFLTRGLTYGHIVDIYLQDNAQLLKQYDETEAREIEHNMGTQIYILSKDDEGRKALSDKLGEIEVQKESANFQSGSDRQDKGNIQQSVEKVPLLSSKELGELLEGEMVLTREVKRNDQRFKKIRPLPIFDTGETSMPNARDLIGRTYSLDYYTTDLRLKNKNKHLKYDDLFKDFANYFVQLANQVRPEDVPETKQTSTINSYMDEVNQQTVSDDGENTETDSQPDPEQVAFAKWYEDYTSDTDAPFLSPSDLTNDKLVDDVEGLMFDLLKRKDYRTRTDEQVEALRQLAHRVFFERYPQMNTKRSVLRLFDQQFRPVWQVDQNKQSILRGEEPEALSETDLAELMDGDASVSQNLEDI
ncbi:type IV secretory system conjugative DNA transfer family protein [Weissella minor]|uniref:type IV secretory system conjugative DNA transfer family protein n=1 Tax=Weissella minor TaxID=1620 RepID=UPI001BB039A5|nr:type IV secretory system conjugative DNA transfer family protein [Weissella minor]MBS0949225.1 type IV secretory system conjugative DNA transfer family protein [Weissella minor]